MTRSFLVLSIPLLAACSRPAVVECIDRDEQRLSEVLGGLFQDAGIPLFTSEERSTRERRIIETLETLKAAGRTSHLGFLLEYGLGVHLSNLEKTQLARKLPLKQDPALAELVRLAEIEPYRDSHEAGWLRNQFYEPPKAGWSSYQIYLWAKERQGADWPNADRINSLLARIDASPAAKVGGHNVCHYGCR